MRRSAPLACLALLAGVPAADAASSRFVVKGAGYGHGIGMSQYGAYGYALQGYDHGSILRAYYTATELGTVSPSPQVRVLLQGGKASYKVTGAARSGDRRLDPARTYILTRDAGGMALKSVEGKTLQTSGVPLRVDAPPDGALRLRGTSVPGVRNGAYRGAIEVRPAGSGLAAVNAVGLEDYVRGVVSAESPSTWPIEALKAQAVAARTYALTTNVGTRDDGIDQYADVRSQVYRGVSAETAPTDRAVAETRSQIVTYSGQPVTTFFFSTSGGHTENVENSFIGSLPKPWLKGVDDPFDGKSPKHRWRIQMTITQAARKLRGLYRGRFRGVRVVQRGVSPRVVRAQVLGTGGNGVATGPELRRRLGLFDTWATFTTVKPKKKKSSTQPKPSPPPAGQGGGVEAAEPAP